MKVERMVEVKRMVGVVLFEAAIHQRRRGRPGGAQEPPCMHMHMHMHMHKEDIRKRMDVQENEQDELKNRWLSCKGDEGARGAGKEKGGKEEARNKRAVSPS